MVYLSKNKVIPSTDSDSLKGFSFNKDRTKVIWESEVQQIIIRDKKGKVNKLATEKVNFPDDTVLHYHHLPYFLSSNTTSVKSIKCWLDNLKTKPQIAKNSPKVSILFSIEAYEKVIQRLMPNYKKNVMNLSEFYKQHDDKTDLLNFIVQAKNLQMTLLPLSFYRDLKISLIPMVLIINKFLLINSIAMCRRLKSGLIKVAIKIHGRILNSFSKFLLKKVKGLNLSSV